MRINQTARIISTYSADNFGVCSALFELGGMIVMHDPSGCNSTYTTHDEPRWYDSDSLIFISALTEQDAVLGRDDKFISDVIESAEQFKPNFISIIPSQIAFLIGTDMKAIAHIIEKRTGIRCFTLPTNSMHYYCRGVYYALEWLASEFIAQKKYAAKKSPSINLLGVTPLDFSTNGATASMKRWLTDLGFQVNCWAMGEDFNSIMQAPVSDINLVVTYGGLGAARKLQNAFGTPYVVGTPIGSMKNHLAKAIKKSLKDKKNRLAYLTYDTDLAILSPNTESNMSAGTADNPLINAYRQNEFHENILIGESIYAQSLARAIADANGKHYQTIVPVETERSLLAADTLQLTDEADLQPRFNKAQSIIADPMYQPIVAADTKFIRLPHEGFSGRLYRKEIPNLIAAGFDDFLRCL